MPQYIIHFEEGNSPGPFNVYLSGSSGETLYAAGITKAQLAAGYVVLFNDGIPSSSIVVVNESFGCGNEINLPFPSITPSITPTRTITPSITPTKTVTPTLTLSITPTITATPSRTLTVTPTSTISTSFVPDLSTSPTPTVTFTRTPSITPTRTTTPQVPNLFLEVSKSMGPSGETWEVEYTNNVIPLSVVVSTTANTFIPFGYIGVNSTYSANPLGVVNPTPIQIRIRKTTNGGVTTGPTNTILFIDEGYGYGPASNGASIPPGTYSSFLDIGDNFFTTIAQIGYKMKLIIIEG